MTYAMISDEVHRDEETGIEYALKLFRLWVPTTAGRDYAVSQWISPEVLASFGSKALWGMMLMDADELVRVAGYEPIWRQGS